MFTKDRSRAPLAIAFGLAELIYHATVRSIRKSHGNAVIGLLLNILQTVILVVVFMVMMNLLGMRALAIRGDYLLYIMSGVFMFMTHNKAMGAVAGAEGPTSAMMKHAPMTTAVAILSAALGALYIQVLSVAVILTGYHVLWTPITIDQPVGALAMLLLAWGVGSSIGMVFLAAKPWAPDAVGIISTLYGRANMIASGKMFVANSLGYGLLRLFDWNPLFHVIDQARGFIFLNYFPHHTSIAYPVWVMLALITIGMMGEFYTRRAASLSWGARR